MMDPLSFGLPLNKIRKQNFFSHRFSSSLFFSFLLRVCCIVPPGQLRVCEMSVRYDGGMAYMQFTSQHKLIYD